MGHSHNTLAGLLACLAVLAPSVSFASAPNPDRPIESVMDEPRIVTRLSTQADPTQQYSLLLPVGYSNQKKWPVLIILDPRGRAEATVEMARPGAIANGWIVLSSYQSRSDDLESITLTALQALLREIGEQYSYDPRRVYLAGMSGTAKSLWTAQQALHGLVAGFIGCGGGRPTELGKFKATPPAFYGMAGLEDFNNQEMHELDAMLAQAGTPRKLAIFEGGHGWPANQSDFTAAIDWLELMAMREGLTARREEWIESQYLEARASRACETWHRSRRNLQNGLRCRRRVN
jgi:predicted esterase